MAKKRIFDVVTDVLAETSELTREEISAALNGLLDHCHKRALDLSGVDTPKALAAAHQYLALTELIMCFGSSLVAIDDIERETLGN